MSLTVKIEAVPKSLQSAISIPGSFKLKDSKISPYSTSLVFCWASAETLSAFVSKEELELLKQRRAEQRDSIT